MDDGLRNSGIGQDAAGRRACRIAVPVAFGNRLNTRYLKCGITSSAILRIVASPFGASWKDISSMP